MNDINKNTIIEISDDNLYYSPECPQLIQNNNLEAICKLYNK